MKSGLINLLLAFLVLVVPASVNAEGEASPFLGPDQWTDPAPATYKISPVGTNLCLARVPGRWVGQRPFLVLETCSENAGQFLELAPHSVGDPFYPATSNVRWRINNRNDCATFARGVIFGPPAIDMLPCDMPANANGDTAFRGGGDQFFILKRFTQTMFEIRNPSGFCWTVQNGNIAAGTQMVLEPCNGQNKQKFTLSFQGGLADIPNRMVAERFGWFRFALGTTSVTADRFRSLRKIDIAGSDYRSFDTENDNGAICAKTCADENQCRAFTWTVPGLQGPSARCWLKNAIPTPTPNENVMSGIVRP